MKLGQVLRESKGQEWIAPRYLSYIVNPDFTAEAIHAAAILSRPERDRSVGWSASSAGRCKREQLYKARKAPAAPYSQRAITAFQNGHYVHLRHQSAGLVAGYLTEVEVGVEIPELNVRGTMDGACSDGPVAEFKSINPRGYATVKQFGPLTEHLRQVNAYMWSSGVDRARILYEDKATNELKEYPVDFDGDMHNLNIADWKELNDRMEDGSLPPMLSECQVMEGKFKWCPFAEVCMKDHLGMPRQLRIRRTSSSDDVSAT